MTPDEFDQFLEDLETRLERLRSLYEQYFMGMERIEPTVARKDVDRRFWLLRREKVRNTARRFRLQMLTQRYNTLQQYWQRTCREIENGTYRRHRLKAERTIGALDRPTGAAASAPTHPPPEEDVVASRAQQATRSAEEDLRALLASDFDPAAEVDAALDAIFGGPPAPAPKAQPPAPTPKQPPGPTPPPTSKGKLPASPPPAPLRSLAPRPGPLSQGPQPPRSAPPGPPPRPAPGSSPASSPGAASPPRLSAPLPPRSAPSASSSAPAPRVPPPRAAALPAGGGSSAGVGGPARPASPAPPAAPRPPSQRPDLGSARARPSGPPPRPNPSRRPPAGAASPVRLPGPPRAPAPQPARPAPPTAAARSSEGSLSDARIKELHARYLASRQGAAGQPVPLEKLAQSLRATEAKLRQQHQGRRIDFDIVVRDGKPIIKPRLT